MIRIVALATLLLGISPFGVAGLTNASVAPVGVSKINDVSVPVPQSRRNFTSRHNVTSIAKNQDYPLRVQLTGNPCDAFLCIDI